ncbi:hypothetical protein [Pseudoroseicyclus sp. CXY001]|uniref:hypothetical protein n=1 Tax=Pseudoroseicyclus sp. CXY001 TaxID=3242492 RepID=UPI00358DD8C5
MEDTKTNLPAGEATIPAGDAVSLRAETALLHRRLLAMARGAEGRLRDQRAANVLGTHHLRDEIAALRAALRRAEAASERRRLEAETLRARSEAQRAALQAMGQLLAEAVGTGEEAEARWLALAARAAEMGLPHEETYLEVNGDVARDGQTAAGHYIRFGARAGRFPHPAPDAG